MRRQRITKANVGRERCGDHPCSSAASIRSPKFYLSLLKRPQKHLISLPHIRYCILQADKKQAMIESLVLYLSSKWSGLHPTSAAFPGHSSLPTPNTSNPMPHNLPLMLVQIIPLLQTDICFLSTLAQPVTFPCIT